MRTAIFVYEPSTITIKTQESSAELSGMDTGTVILAAGTNVRSFARGIYKVLSNEDLELTGNPAVFDFVVTTQHKDNDPVPPSRAITLVEPIDTAVLHAFFVVPEAKEIAHP